MQEKSFQKLVLAVQRLVGATAVIFKRDFSVLDADGSVVQYKIGGYWTGFKKTDVEDYYAMGETN